ncbi:MAG TPA: DUF1540 domain-containing protein [Firmicutes bacterium]|nr:DUF1540 domain-containing protein [Bacillota bacterium]
MAQHIHCTVSNCHYYSSGNKCLASEIVVVNDQFGLRQPDMQDATQSANFPETPASSCMETCCKTFTHAGGDKTHVDGVTKSQANFGGSNRTR